MNSVEEEKSTVQSPGSISEEKIKKLVEDVCKQTMTECFKAFEENKTHKPEGKSFWKNLSAKNLIIYMSILSTLIAGFMSWNNKIITEQINEIQAEKIEKIKLQKELSSVIFDTRSLILNQNALCKIQKRSPIELRVERQNSLNNIGKLNATILSIFDAQAASAVSEMVADIYQVNDVCSLNGDEFDHRLQIIYRNIGAKIYKSIKENTDKINYLTKKRYWFEIPIKATG